MMVLMALGAAVEVTRPQSRAPAPFIEAWNLRDAVAQVRGWRAFWCSFACAVPARLVGGSKPQAGFRQIDAPRYRVPFAWSSSPRPNLRMELGARHVQMTH